jgi:hypothetical protein
VSAPTAKLGADTRVLTCYGACNRTRQVYTRLLGSRPVYSCGGCGATREIHELGGPEVSRLVPIIPMTDERLKDLEPMKGVAEAIIAKAMKGRLASSPKRAADALRLRAARDTRHAQEMKPMPKEPTAPPMRALIFDIVGQALAEQPKPLTADEVREIVQTELNRAFGIETKAAGGAKAKITAETCVRMPHKGQHGRACREALEAAK